MRHGNLERFVAVVVSIVALGFIVGFSQRPQGHRAADEGFHVLTVDSTGDASDAAVGDGRCDDGAGRCTLRAAIEESNSTPGVDAIEFDISGPGDFVMAGRQGYTISPRSALPSISTTLTIDGYSQPGSAENTRAAPAPLDTRLLIRIDGSLAGGPRVCGLDAHADGITIRGLVISGFSQAAVGIGADRLTIQGNFLGTDPDGRQASPNLYGISNASGGSDLLVGGLDPADRNLVSGNTNSGITPDGSAPSTNSDRWTVQGNYVGVDRTGMAPLPNNSLHPAGALSLDNSAGHVVGGPAPTAVNVISGNADKGIAPDNSDDLVVEGNYIGVAADGVTPMGNGTTGILFSDTGSENAVVKDNVISYNVTGIYVDNVHTMAVVGNTIQHNDLDGIDIAAGTDHVTIGGTTVADRNVVSGNGPNNPQEGNIKIECAFVPCEHLEIQGNYVGVDTDGRLSDALSTQGYGISLTGQADNSRIGGIEPGAGNLIAGNGGPGVAVVRARLGASGVVITPRVTILGNSIHDNAVGSISGLGSSGLGIDVYTLWVDDSFVRAGLPDLGPTPAGSSAVDAAGEFYANAPSMRAAVQVGAMLDLTYDLAVPDGPPSSYRVEFFANDTADPSGYGEGQIFLGAVTSSGGADRSVGLRVPVGLDLSGRSIAATATPIDPAPAGGFGATSEFGPTVSVVPGGR